MSLVKRIGIPLAGGAMLAAVPLVSYFEGKENSAYYDPVGIVTICYGHTGTARIEKKKLMMLEQEHRNTLDKHEAEMARFGGSPGDDR